ncbi:AmmeMemoRadiSam system protein B [Mariprofundus erugo]|uniref:AmmeMemoRadiSam system protein B n=1 Tax=Mariprofundus erugo TaxID=2528639 RepID=UPI0010FE36D8|nr:AmmeMemoRadiSam system protein B [Mariprofundus erugo]TLS74271.1 AmmeMemoRadiSam system protein B [Mariprofundus erugo]
MYVRTAAVAGLFYPADPTALQKALAGYLAVGRVQCTPPRALIVPHAGYIYSAPTAACGYATLVGSHYSRVVLVGPAHRVATPAIAVPSCHLFRTPLGDIPVADVIQKLVIRFDGVETDDVVHAPEHSLEVQLPFLQVVLSSFELVPLCVGDVDPVLLAQVLESLWDEGTLFVISSDLSHYHASDEAVRRDHASIARILAGSHLMHAQACGATGINAMLLLAARHRLQARLLDYRHSGDTAGDMERVVGYASIAFEGGLEDA